MIRYRLAQSNSWVYSVKKIASVDDNHRARDAMRRLAELELQAWIMKMDKTREFLPAVVSTDTFDARERVWRIDASWVSPRMLHEIGNKI